MNKFLELKCRPWVIVAAVMSLLSTATMSMGCGGGGSGRISVDSVTTAVCLVFFWLAVTRMFALLSTALIPNKSEDSIPHFSVRAFDEAIDEQSESNGNAIQLERIDNSPEEKIPCKV